MAQNHFDGTIRKNVLSGSFVVEEIVIPERDCPLLQTKLRPTFMRILSDYGILVHSSTEDRRPQEAIHCVELYQKENGVYSDPILIPQAADLIHIVDSRYVVFPTETNLVIWDSATLQPIYNDPNFAIQKSHESWSLRKAIHHTARGAQFVVWATQGPAVANFIQLFSIVDGVVTGGIFMISFSPL